jgi:hypothetical protein
MGFSSSDSKSTQATTNNQTTYSAAGGSGTNSPTVIAGGSVTLTDGGATNSALKGMSDVALAALDEQNRLNQASLDLLSNFNANEAAATVSSTKDNTDLLASVLANNQTLAQNVQSGGATTGMDLTTKVVNGAMILMGLLIAFMLFRK